MPSMGMIVQDGIGPVLDFLMVNAAGNVAQVMEQGQQQVEAYAKSNAPWSDITGSARNGLTARVFMEGGEVVLELAHTVEHGYWLEVIQDGAFAIIMPTLEALGPEIIRDAGGAVMRVEGVW